MFIICTPIFDGGLSLRSISKINNASNLKLWLEIMNFNNLWNLLLKSTIIIDCRRISYHNSSFIWCRIKPHLYNITHKPDGSLTLGAKSTFGFMTGMMSLWLTTFTFLIKTILLIPPRTSLKNCNIFSAICWSTLTKFLFTWITKKTNYYSSSQLQERNILRMPTISLHILIILKTGQSHLEFFYTSFKFNISLEALSHKKNTNLLKSVGYQNNMK